MESGLSCRSPARSVNREVAELSVPMVNIIGEALCSIGQDNVNQIYCTGVLTPGKGNRLVLASTEELHDRIDSMSSRMRQLESALRDLQSSVSTEKHPLLQDGLSLLSSGQPTPTPPPLAPPTLDVELGSLEQQPSQPSQPSAPVASGSRQTLDHQPMQIDEQIDEAETCGKLVVYVSHTSLSTRR